MHTGSATAFSVTHGDRTASIDAAGGEPVLRLHHAAGQICRIALGIAFDGVDLGPGAEILSASSRTIDEEWTAAFGKAAGTHRVRHDELTVALRTNGTDWSVVVRVAHDGFAFRYRLPGSDGILGREATRLSVPPETRAWLLEYTTWYETPRFGSDLSALAPGEYGLPLLLQVSPDSYALISEADIDGRSSGAHASYDGDDFRVTPADDALDIGAHHLTPWRVVIAGELHEVVASTLVDDLAPAAAPGAFAARPGRAAWSWWSSQYSGAYLDVQKRFADFAAEQGWEHVLVDCGWDAAWVPELVAHASVRGVQVHLWSAWDDLDGDENLAKLALWRSWGVAGIKVDFMESESRDRYRWYDAIIAEAARVGLAVNFHGSVIPRGWARTHPHVVSYEGIRGAEYYVFYGNPLTAAHNVIQPFTRNVVGSMDYTPVTFSAPERETTDGHELALGIVYESGITHFADDPDQYRARPAAAGILAEIPPRWDETRLIDGHPDSHAVLARRSGERWFIGCIGANDSERDVSFDPARLAGGAADVLLVHDADGALVEREIAGAERPVSVPLPPRGGFVAIVAPAGTATRRRRLREPLPAPSADERLVILTGDGVDVRTDAASVRTPHGWAATRRDGGTWRLAPTAPAPAGSVAVITLERPGHDGVPVVSHVRIVVPLDGSPTDASTLPFLSARNAVGPVERGLANGGGDPRDGEPLRVGGTEFPDGLGVAHDSEVRIAVRGARRLTGLAAIDDETPDAHATVEILRDDRPAFSADVAGGSAPVPFALDVTDSTVLTLRTTTTTPAEAHVDWLTLRLDG